MHLHPAWYIAEESDIVSEHPDGAAELFASLVREYPRVLAYCRAHLGSRQEAEDAAQETYTRLVVKAAAVAGHGSPAGWLWTTARFVCLEHLRRNGWATGEGRRRAEASQRHTDQWHGGAKDDEHQRHAALRLVEGLPFGLRAASRLALQGYAYAEIAERLGIGVDAVYVRMSRAARRLQQLVDEDAVRWREQPEAS